MLSSYNSFPSCNLNSNNDITFTKKAPSKDSYNQSKSLCYPNGSKFHISLDEIDNPVTKVSLLDKTPFQTMKHEINRLESYTGKWPVTYIQPAQLAECGLYYTGKADIVNCFFCGGSLWDWKPNDDPWVEHAKLYPNCAYLSLHRRHGGMQRQHSAPQSLAVLQPPEPHSESNPVTSLTNEIISEANNIFSESLVQTVVLQHLKKTSQHFTSLTELCEAVLEHVEKENSPRISYDVTGHTDVEQTEYAVNRDTACSDPGNFTERNKLTVTEESQTNCNKEVNEILLCKICMDREIGVLFQPCGHQFTCPKCAQGIFNCPTCRSPVTNKVRTYIG